MSEPRIVTPQEAREHLAGAESCWEIPWTVNGLDGSGHYYVEDDTAQHKVAEGMLEDVALLLAAAPALARTVATEPERQESAVRAAVVRALRDAAGAGESWIVQRARDIENGSML